MIELCYSTFGLTQLDFLQAIREVDKAGYAGVELAFHRDQFNPFEISDEDLENVKKLLQTTRTRAACVATASHFFTPSRPHEPSLMCLETAGRKRRVNLVKRGVQVARKLGVPLVTFGSGFIREEHVANPRINPKEVLADSIHQCLRELRDDEDMTLLIEPEPGMFIETLDQGLDLVETVNSPRFKLHLDLCHDYCSESDYIGALKKAAPHARFLHISDAREGYNLKILKDAPQLSLDLNFASYLIYFPASADFLFVDRRNPVYFFNGEAPDANEKKRAEEILGGAGIEKEISYVDYESLYAGTTEFEDEIFTYLISVPGLSFEILEVARPIIAYLRSKKGADGGLMMDKMVANTLTGIVHFHEIPGEGTLDFEASFNALREHGFSGFASVELYHHVASWKKALDDSFRHLSQYVG